MQKSDVDRVKNRLEPFGYVCVMSEEKDLIILRCSPNPKTYDRDRINRIDVFFPKREDLVNIEILTPKDYPISTHTIKKTVQEWVGSPHIYESRLVGFEFRNGARKFAPAIIADIIRERRKPLVMLPKRRLS